MSIWKGRMLSFEDMWVSLVRTGGRQRAGSSRRSQGLPGRRVEAEIPRIPFTSGTVLTIAHQRLLYRRPA
jgi:hypothetical protein